MSGRWIWLTKRWDKVLQHRYSSSNTLPWGVEVSRHNGVLILWILEFRHMLYDSKSPMNCWKLNSCPASVPSILKRWSIFLDLVIIYLTLISSFIYLFVCLLLVETGSFYNIQTGIERRTTLLPQNPDSGITGVHCHIGLVFVFIKYIKIMYFIGTQVDKNNASDGWWLVALSIYKKRKRKQKDTILVFLPWGSGSVHILTFFDLTTLLIMRWGTSHIHV